MSMKRIFIAIIGMVIMPTLAAAASFSVMPGSAAYTVGQTVTADVYIVPSDGESITAAKLDLSFDTDELELVSYNPVSTSPVIGKVGTTVNKAGGTVVDNFGFNPGVTNKFKIASLTFKMNKEGVANVKIGETSMLLASDNTNKASGIALATYTISKPTPAVQPTQQSQAKPRTQTITRPAPKPVVTETVQQDIADILTTKIEKATDETPAEEQDAQQDDVIQTGDQEAAAAQAGAGYNWLWWLLLILALLVAVWYFLLRKKREE